MFRFDLLNLSGRMPNLKSLNTPARAHTHRSRALHPCARAHTQIKSFTALYSLSREVFSHCYYPNRHFPQLFLHQILSMKACLFFCIPSFLSQSLKTFYMTFLKLIAFSPHSRLSVGLLSLKVVRNNSHICFL